MSDRPRKEARPFGTEQNTQRILEKRQEFQGSMKAGLNPAPKPRRSAETYAAPKDLCVKKTTRKPDAHALCKVKAASRFHQCRKAGSRRPSGGGTQAFPRPPKSSMLLVRLRRVRPDSIWLSGVRLPAAFATQSAVRERRPYVPPHPSLPPPCRGPPFPKVSE